MSTELKPLTDTEIAELEEFTKADPEGFLSQYIEQLIAEVKQSRQFIMDTAFHPAFKDWATELLSSYPPDTLPELISRARRMVEQGLAPIEKEQS